MVNRQLIAKHISLAQMSLEIQCTENLPSKVLVKALRSGMVKTSDCSKRKKQRQLWQKLVNHQPQCTLAIVLNQPKNIQKRVSINKFLIQKMKVTVHKKNSILSKQIL